MRGLWAACEPAEEKDVAKRPSNLESVMLAVELLRRIPRKRKVTAQELHEQLQGLGFDRDERSIQRHLAELSAHFEIERDESSRPYGYRWKSQARAVALPDLNAAESVLFQLAESYLKHLLPANLNAAVAPFFDQARRNLAADNNQDRAREWTQKVRVVSASQPLLPPAIKAGVFEVVSEALYENLWLDLRYRNAQGKSRDIAVMPLGLAQQGQSLYLVCRFRGYENERSLALHRILSAQASTLSFERPPEFDLQAYDDDGRFGFGEGERIRLRFCITAKEGQHLRETRLSTDQVLTEQADGSLCVEATVVDSTMLTRWLRGFGEAVWGVEKQPVAQSSDNAAKRTPE